VIKIITNLQDIWLAKLVNTGGGGGGGSWSAGIGGTDGSDIVVIRYAI